MELTVFHCFVVLFIFNYYLLGIIKLEILWNYIYITGPVCSLTVDKCYVHHKFTQPECRYTTTVSAKALPHFSRHSSLYCWVFDPKCLCQLFLSSQTNSTASGLATRPSSVPFSLARHKAPFTHFLQLLILTSTPLLKPHEGPTHSTLKYRPA